MGDFLTLNTTISTESTESIKKLTPPNIDNQGDKRNGSTLFSCKISASNHHSRKLIVWFKEMRKFTRRTDTVVNNITKETTVKNDTGVKR